jgi:hypothetical protein
MFTHDQNSGTLYVLDSESCVCRKCSCNILDRAHTQAEHEHQSHAKKFVRRWLTNSRSSAATNSADSTIPFEPDVEGWSDFVLMRIENEWLNAQSDVRER